MSKIEKKTGEIYLKEKKLTQKSLEEQSAFIILRNNEKWSLCARFSSKFLKIRFHYQTISISIVVEALVNYKYSSKVEKHF